MTRRRRIALASLTFVGVILLLAVGRWYVARERVADVARNVDARRAPSFTVASAALKSVVVPGAVRSESDAVGRAAMHRHAVDHYRTRAETDLAALPPAYQPLNEERLTKLKLLADEGSARAACVLAAQISKCSFFVGVGKREAERAERQIDEHQRAGRTPPSALVTSFERISAAQRQLATECAGVSFPPEHAAWRYQLQAALLGHAPSMATFSTWPAIDPSSPSVSIDAIAAYVQYAGPFIEALAQRGDLNAVTQASWSYADVGPSIMREFGVRELPRDPARSLMFSYVRADIMRRWELAEPGSSTQWGKPEYRIKEMELAVSESDRAWARQMADQMIASFDAKAFQPPVDQPDRKRPDNIWEAVEDTCRE